jgi:hypothetical protein
MKLIFSPPRLYIRVVAVDRKTTCFVVNLLCRWCDLLFNRLEDMENGKRSAEEALDESVPPHQHLHHQEDVTCDLGWMDLHLNMLQDTFTISEHRADSTQARLAEAEARIMGEMSTTIFCFLSFIFKILNIPPFTMLEKQISDASKESLVTQITRVTYVASLM